MIAYELVEVEIGKYVAVENQEWFVKLFAQEVRSFRAAPPPACMIRMFWCGPYVGPAEANEDIKIAASLIRRLPRK